MNPNEIPLPPAPPSVPVVTGAPAVPSNAQPAQAPSMLDRLREQVMKDVMPSDVESMQARARAFGAGMLGGQGNFFQRLASGENAIAQLQQQDQQARANRLKAAEEDAYRQAQVRLEEAKQRYLQDPTSWQARAALMKAEADMIQAQAMSSRASQERRDRPLSGGLAEDPNTGEALQLMESGEIRRLGVPFRNLSGVTSSYEREYTRWQALRERTYAEIDANKIRELNNPMNMRRPADIEQEAAAKKRDFDLRNPPPRERQYSSQRPSQEPPPAANPQSPPAPTEQPNIVNLGRIGGR